MVVLVEERGAKWRFLGRESEGKLGGLVGKLSFGGRALVVVVLGERWRVSCILGGRLLLHVWKERKALLSG